MKNKILNTLIVSSLCLSVGFAGESAQGKPHQIYFGPEVVSVAVNTHIKNVHIQGTKQFGGFRLGYEFVQPRSFYAGVDFLSTFSSHRYSASRNGDTLEYSHEPMGFDNFDLRFGYTALIKDMLVIPFAGLGIYGLGTVPHDKGFHEGWVYVSTGVRSEFPINAVFNIGINAKILKSFFGYREFKNHATKVSVYPCPWGAEIGIPFTWNFNPRGTWKFQIEPYWTKLDFSETQNALGSKFLINVHF